MGITRKIVGWLPYIGGMFALIAAFEWVDYHTTKGVSPIWGRNPRCVDHQWGYCFKLDTSNMPWDATLATWIGQGVWLLTIVFVMVFGAAALAGAISGVLLLARVAASPHQDRLPRLADSQWLMFETWGLACLLVAGTVTALLWARMEIVGLLVMAVGGFLAIWASLWADSWAARYRHKRFLAQQTLANEAARKTVCTPTE